MSLKMFVWQVHPTFLGIAQANSVAEARHALLCSDLGESGDGSCPERDAARQFILEHFPAIWHGVNAEFVLSDSAELREQEQHSRALEARVAALEADLAAAREEIARRTEDSADLDWLAEIGEFEQQLSASGDIHECQILLPKFEDSFVGYGPDWATAYRAAIAAARAGGTR